MRKFFSYLYTLNHPDTKEYPINLYQRYFKYRVGIVTAFKMTKHKKMSPQFENAHDFINHLIKTEQVDTNLISDGYHTFGELYEHRITLFIALCRFLEDHPYKAHLEIWKSKLHSDGSSFDGWFIMGIGTAKGEQISYHLPMSKWDDCDVIIRDRAPEWDGHTHKDVLERIKNM